jgi:hypothetical protein
MGTDWLGYLFKEERPIVVALVVVLTGTAALLFEYKGYASFEELPPFARPLGLLIWLASAFLIVVRVAMAVPRGLRFVAAMPMRYRQVLADEVIIDRLNGTKGLAREVLCFARFRSSDHIWVDDRPELPKWLDSLLGDGLVQVTDAAWRTVHYSIHPVAWQYMLKYPNKFQHRFRWRNEPWTEKINEADMEKKLEEMS